MIDNRNQVPRELSFISQHSFVQRTILSRGHNHQHLRTDEGIGVLGLCGKIYPFFFQKSFEGSRVFSPAIKWIDPYQEIGALPAGPILAGYIQGGWSNNTLAQWQRAHQNPAVLFFPDEFVVNPQLETLNFPLPTPEISKLGAKFLVGL